MSNKISQRLMSIKENAVSPLTAIILIEVVKIIENFDVNEW
jgi:hypothetical protein